MQFHGEHRPQTQEIEELRFGKRLRNRIALQEVEAKVAQVGCAQVVFDTFRNNMEAQSMAKVTDRGDNGVICCRAHTTHDKALIDLQLIESEVWQQGEGGVAIPKSSMAMRTPRSCTGRS